MLTAVGRRVFLNKRSCASFSSVSVTNTQQQHPIVSRRAAGYFLTSKSPNASSSQNAKKDDTPWPRSLQLLGYAIAALAVPFSVGAAIVEIPSFRRFVEGGDDDQLYDDEKINGFSSAGGMCVRAVREFWGDEEYRAENETCYTTTKTDEVKESFKSFSNEDPAPVRRAQREVGRNIHAPHKLRVTFISGTTAENSTPNGFDSSSFVEIPQSCISSVVGVVDDGTMKLGDGSSIDGRQHFLESLKGNKTFSSTNIEQSPLVVALDFLDETEEKSKEESYEHVDHYPSSSVFQEESPAAKVDGGEQLRSLTQTWSSWHNFPSPSSSTPKDTKISADEIRKSELEWKKTNLKAQLNDPTCLRDIDEMQMELKEIERELRSMRRKKWFLI